MHDRMHQLGLSVVLAATACSDPYCPDGFDKVGNVCNRVDSGMDAVNAGDASSGEARDAGNDDGDNAALETGTTADPMRTGQDAGVQNAQKPTDLPSGDAAEPAIGDDAGPELDAAPQPDAAPQAECAVTWYADCDEDGFAARNAANTSACEKPAARGGCLGWTDKTPMEGRVDCNDNDPNYHPGAGYGLSGSGDGDLNCDGVVEREPILRKSSATPSGNGDSPVCQTPQQCGCVFELSGNAFACSGDANDWVRDFGNRLLEKATLACKTTLPNDVAPLRFVGLQYCR